MQITVFGANGRVGSKVVTELLSKNCKVVAFVHGSSKLPPHKNLVVTHGDINDQKEVSKAIKSSDAVISALGSWGTPTKDILTRGMTTIIPAMEKAGTKRLISLTGAEARFSSDKPNMISRLSHFSLGVIAPKILADGEHHIKLLEESSLDWTVLRSPVMRESSMRGYKLSNKLVMPWQSIDRNDVVDALIKLAVGLDYVRQCPTISRS